MQKFCPSEYRDPLIGLDHPKLTKSVFELSFIKKNERIESSHIAQNIPETCQEYFQSFIAEEILS